MAGMVQRRGAAAESDEQHILDEEEQQAICNDLAQQGMAHEFRFRFTLQFPHV